MLLSDMALAIVREATARLQPIDGMHASWACLRAPKVAVRRGGEFRHRHAVNTRANRVAKTCGRTTLALNGGTRVRRCVEENEHGTTHGSGLSRS